MIVFPMFHIFFIIVCEFETVITHIYIEDKSDDSQVERTSEYFSTFIYNLGKTYFTENEVIYFLIPTQKDEMYTIIEKCVQKMLRTWSVFFNDSYCCANVEEGMLSYNKKIQTYLVPGIYIVPFYQKKTFEYFEAQIKMLQKPDNFNPRALFFIVFLLDGRYESSQLQPTFIKVFNLMWRNNLFAATLFLLSSCSNQITVASARPFSIENQCRTVKGNGISIFNISKENETKINLFYKEKVNLQKCEIYIGTIPLPPYVVGKPKTVENELYYDYVGGIEVELVRLLSESMNFTLKFHKTHSYGLDAWFAKLPNGTIIGILQDLLDHNIDMAFGGFIPDYVTYYKYDYSKSYKFSSISFYATDPNFIPQWLIFFVAFTFEVWMVSIFVFLFVTLLYYLMERFGITDKQRKDLTGIHFSDFFSINLGMGSMLDPESAHLRVLFFAWAVYSVHWYSVYTSILFTYITNPPLEKEIKTIYDLKESGLKVSLDVTYKEIFAHNQIDTVAKSVLNNHLICTHLETCVQRFVQDRNFSVMDKAEGIEYLVSLKQSKVHKLSQNMMTYFVSTITTRGNPVSSEFSRVALIAFEAGLLSKWERDVGLQYRNLKSVDIATEDDSIPLSVEDLIGSYLILIFGLLISFVVFIAEILINRYKKDKVKEI